MSKAAARVATSVARHAQPNRSRVLSVGLAAGATSGIIVLVPVLALQAVRGIGVIPEMQLAASSVIGLEAYVGLSGLVLGTLLHFFVSIVPALAYAIIAWRVSQLNRWAWIAGPVLGLLVFFFMGFVVLPQTAFATPPGVTPMPLFPALLIHMFGLGVPIAQIVQRWLAPIDAPQGGGHR